MLAILLKTLPFFAVIGLGYGAGRLRFFSPEATAYLTKFVFYFALSAMLFGFAANLDLGDVFSWAFVWAYFLASALVWAIVAGVALLRGAKPEVAVFEAHTGIIGNVGFLGIPMLTLLLGPAAVGPVLLVLAVDLVVFSSLLTLLVVGLREGRMSWGIFQVLGLGLLKNPMIVSVVLGMAWGATGWALPVPVNEFMTMLGAAATPCALFAIGASLAGRSAERLEVAAWLSFAKLALHPAAVALAALVIFPVERYAAGVMIAAASLPVAGNVFILAQHYGVAPQRVSTAILISTAASVLSVTAVIAFVTG
ncbi:MAG: AEC family transporter [Cypionkella sp.]|uniref:AEC family transporter n=1 Tax=Cypionkella sp. TaxID=2811411 RepID=UPI002AB8D7A1|nr:AEC family transporter [Cypionkella sp.]MDZ4311365.1 AEC family transporter [Cypionkella sp.]MDZ4395866.1 AEC family transporter [Cypionkella sp.]